MDEKLISEPDVAASLATIEFEASDGGTHLVVTEQGVFLDDFDDARGCERGTQILINQLEQALHRQSMNARS